MGVVKPGEEWVNLIEVRGGEVIYLCKEVVADSSFDDFWIDPRIYRKSHQTQKNICLSPGVLVFTFSVMDFPVCEFMKSAIAFSSTSKSCAGASSKAKGWIKKHSSDNLVFIAFNSMASISIIGNDAALSVLVDRFMTEGGFKGRYKEFCPNLWLNKMGENGIKDIEIAAKEIFLKI